MYFGFSPGGNKMKDFGLFNQVIKKGIQKIRETDSKAQDKFIEIICKDVRGMDPKVVHQANAFYVPNDDYMVTMFGEILRNSQYDCYLADNTCRWLNNLVFPITNLAGTVVGLAGYNPHNYLQAKETGDKSLNYYGYSNKELFVKGHYIYCLEGVYKQAIEQGYLILADGLFDCLSLSSYGYLAAALLGSNVSEQVLAQLTFVDRIILAYDNDEAGLRLARFLTKKLNNVVCVKQKYTKDVDDLLKTSYKDNYLEMLNNVIQKKSNTMNLF